MKDHTECYQVDYDPEVLDYEDLLDIFWNSHNPTARAFSRQYRSVILYDGDKQHATAKKSLAAQEKKRGVVIQTALEPFKKFYYAEDYHQKYYLRRHDIVENELKAFLRTGRAFADSPVATRLNAVIGGHLPRKRLLAEIEGYGLSKKAQDYIKKKAGITE